MKLKKLNIIGIGIVSVFAFASCGKDEHHDHDHEGHDGHEEHEDHADEEKHAKHEHEAGGGQIAGPSGGRVITAVEPHLEFFVTEDRKVKITPVNDELEPVELSGQTVKVTGGDRSNPTILNFAERDGVLISDGAFPEGNDFPVVVQITPSADGETTIEKFNLNLEECPTCDYREYACVCDHGE